MQFVYGGDGGNRTRVLPSYTCFIEFRVGGAGDALRP